MATPFVRTSGALSSCASPVRILAAAGLAASLAGAAHGAQITANWLSAASGTWNVATNWSTNPNFPNNGADTYIAVIDAVGSAYTVTLSTTVTLDELTLNSANALVSHTAGSFNPGTANVMAGTYRMNGGTVSGGTWNVSGSGVFDAAANSLNLISNATINGDVIASAASARTRISGTTRFETARLTGGNSSLGFVNGYTLMDDVSAEGATGGTRNLEMSGAGTLTIGATGSVTHAAGVGGDLDIGGSQWFGGAMTLVNNGLIENNSIRTTSIQSSGGFTNNGTLRLTSGATSIGGGGWINNGTVEMTGGTLNLGAFNITGGIGTWNRTGGTVNINGALNNAANTFTLDSTTGSWTLNAGSINGGTVDFADGSQLLIAAQSTNNLVDVDLNGDVVASAASARTRISGTTRFETARLQGGNSSLGFVNGYTLMDDVSAEGATGGTRNLEMSGAGTLTIGATGTVTHAAGVGGDLDIGGSQWFGGAMTLVNNGLIENNSARNTNILPSGGFTNNGTLRLTSGATSIGGGGWVNNGTVEMTGGTLNLGAFNITGGIGTWNRTGGTVNINGALNNAANTFTLDSATGSWTLNAGSINGGTVNFAGGAELLIAAQSTNNLVDVDLNGDVIASAASARTRLSGTTRFETARLQGGNSSLGFVNGYTLMDDVSAEGAAGGTRNLEMSGAGTLTIGATGTVTHAAGVGGDLDIGGSQWFGGAMTLVNNGLIENNSARNTNILPSGGFTNNGTLRLTSGATSISAWSNTGLVEVSGGTLNLGAFNITGGIGTWNRTGGTVNINGALNNAANTFTLDSTTGSWTLNAGSISGGTVNFAGGSQLLIAAQSTNNLVDVDLNGDVVESAASARTRISGTTRFETARLQGGNSSLGFVNGYTLMDDVSAEGAAGGTRNLEMSGAGTLTIGATGTVTHAAGVGGDLDIGGSQWYGGAMTLVNNGLIENNSGRTTSIQSSGGFTNNGTLRLTSGATSISAWSNTGLVEVSGGTLNLGAFNVTSGIGTWNRTGGTVNINGALNNAASNFTLDSATGSWTLNAGSINGGTVDFADGSQLLIAAQSTNNLVGVDLNGDVFASAASARTRISGSTRFETARLSGSNSSLGFVNGYTLMDDVVAEGAAGGSRHLEMSGAGTLTIGATGTVTHAAGVGADLDIGGSQWFGGAMTLVNNGLIQNNAAGRSTSVLAASFDNQGTVRANAGTVVIGTASATWANNGDVIAGPGGTVRFLDAYDADASTGDLTVEIAGALAANYGRVNITVPTTIDGADFDLDFINGFTPDWGDKFTILTFDSGEVTGDFSSFVLPALADAVNWRWYTEETLTSVAVGVRHTSDVNRDNFINFADVNTIVSNFNAPGTPQMGDVNEDGFVNFADLNQAIAFFNTSAPPNLVPAPAPGIAFVLVGSLAVARRRRAA